MSDLATLEAFRSVSRCPNVAICLEGDAPHPCRDIIDFQGATSLADFQVPEPWVGQIDIAPILFVSSNPSIGEDDHSKGSASNDAIWDAHHLAFGGGSRQYIIDGTKTTSEDGSILKSVRYWSSVRARARELIPNREIVPGIDYALTEIVHCKTTREYGVAAATQTCAEMHLERVLSVAGALLIVVMGVVARHALLPDLARSNGIVERVVGGRQRTLVALPHPNERGSLKSFRGNYDPHVLSDLRACLVE